MVKIKKWVGIVEYQKNVTRMETWKNLKTPWIVKHQKKDKKLRVFVDDNKNKDDKSRVIFRRDIYDCSTEDEWSEEEVEEEEEEDSNVELLEFDENMYEAEWCNPLNSRDPVLISKLVKLRLLIMPSDYLVNQMALTDQDEAAMNCLKQLPLGLFTGTAAFKKDDIILVLNPFKTENCVLSFNEVDNLINEDYRHVYEFLQWTGQSKKSKARCANRPEDTNQLKQDNYVDLVKSVCPILFVNSVSQGDATTTANVEFGFSVENKNFPCLTALRDIGMGEELLASYMSQHPHSTSSH